MSMDCFHDVRIDQAKAPVGGSFVRQDQESALRFIRPQTGDTRPLEHSIAIIDSRNLVRECLAKGLSSLDVTSRIVTYASLEEWRAKSNHDDRYRLVVVSACGQSFAEMKDEWSTISSLPCLPTAVAIIADHLDAHQLSETLKCGVRGYIPSSMNLTDAVDALHLILTGGIFVPLSCFRSSPVAPVGQTPPNTSYENVHDRFTERQLAVLQALRRGKSNKIIAHELNLAESTVKVHVRSLMKRLKASNRTQVTYIFNQISGQSA